MDLNDKLAAHGAVRAMTTELLTAKQQIIAALGPLDVRQALGLLRDLVRELDPPTITSCSGLTSSWCPIHGNCTCPVPTDALDDPGCPLHAPGSTHAEEATS